MASLLALWAEIAAVDLGTANTLVYVRGEGIVLNEPSVVAIDIRDGSAPAVGSDAKRMIGRTPSHIQASRPLRDGVIADFDMCEQMLATLLKRSTRVDLPNHEWFVFHRNNRVEQRAVQEAAEFAGARNLHTSSKSQWQQQ